LFIRLFDLPVVLLLTFWLPLLWETHLPVLADRTNGRSRPY